jgi:uncharacterized repeat protein (TIGR03803 family)
MRDQFSELIKKRAQFDGSLGRLLSWMPGRQIAFIFGLLAVSMRTLLAQSVQPEMLFQFPYGGVAREPQYPYGNLLEGTDGSFYGTTTGGGGSNLGTVFKVTTNGILTTVASFNNTNGAAPYAGLTLGNDGNFYGTASQGGTSGAGTVFKVTTNGTLTSIASFANTNGAAPEAALTLGPDGSFYGTTVAGGHGYGTIFRVATDGTLAMLVSFDASNGSNPFSSLTLGADGSFYGTTSGGGNGYGTVFKVTTNGVLSTLALFNGVDGDSSRAGLTLGADGSYYGTSLQGSGGYGTVFKVTTNGVLTRLAAFNASNGFGPISALTLGEDGNFYGTTGWGGNSSGQGTIFRVTTNGVITRLLAFNGDSGLEPHAGLTLGSDGNFYGAAAAGGGGGGTGGTGVGTLFKITPGGVFTKIASLGKTVGATPEGALTVGPDGFFYGTTAVGGSNGYGMLFKATSSGTVTTLGSFNNLNGAYPHATLTRGKDDNLYGVTEEGGASPPGYTGVGTIFRLSTNGGLASLYSFFSSTSLNGAYPRAPLTLGNDGNFYGTATSGGSSGFGTVFRLTPLRQFTRLASFNSTNGTPAGGLILARDGSFYGLTSSGGTAGMGTVFRVTTNGVLTTLASFDAADGQFPQGALTLGNDGNFYGLTASRATTVRAGLFRVSPEGILTKLGLSSYFDGAGFPLPPLTLAVDGNFYGTTPGGSSDRPGTLFQVTTKGTFATMFSFANTNGAVPLASLTLGLDGNLYGTTAGGGIEWQGTIFRVSFGAPVVINQPQPATQTVLAGVNVTLEPSVFGAPPLTFQWMRNGTAMAGQTNLSLTLSNVVPSTSAYYALFVTNDLGRTLSSNALITIVPALITNLPLADMTATGVVVRGSVTVGANPTLAWFEWGLDMDYGQIAGVINIPGGTGTTLISAVLSGLDYNAVYHYRIVIWNSFGIQYGADQSFRAGVNDQSTPIAVSGYNRDVVLERTALTPYNAFTMTFDNEYASFFEQGSPVALDNLPGLPSGGAFTSALDGTTQFQLGPYATNNVLYLARRPPYSGTGTLSLSGGPQSYISLSILAASADASTGESSFVINFSDGTSSGPIQYYAPDWYYPIGLSNSAITVGRVLLPDGSVQGAVFALYQTDINLSTLGLSVKPITSLTFTIATNAIETGIFALSGASAVSPPPIQVTSLTSLTNSLVQLTISSPQTRYLTVLSTTNAALPVASWVPLGSPTEIGPGIFQFKDLQSSNFPTRFYRVRSP